MIQVPIVSTYNAKGVNQATKSLSKFDKSVAKLGKSFLGVFAAQKLLAYGEASIKAFAADDKAARILAKSLDNLGLAYANPAVKDFIANLETQFGVLDDQLRPAYQKLLTTTGDWRKSQDLLKTALDLSAMSGLDVVSVTADLSKAYAGNTRGLMKYGLGLSKTQLAGMKFEDILKQITKISGGQAVLAADTYAGSLEKLNVAANNAKESIGKGLVQALVELNGSNGFDGALKGINDFANGISDAIIGVERLQKIIGFFVYNTKGTNPITQMNEFNKANAKADMLSRQQYGGAAANKYTAEADKAAALKLAKAKKDELALLTAKNKTTKEEAQMKADQAALDKLKAKFDLERIGLNAALNNATDEETKARIRAQIAILDETGKTAQAANDALVKAQADKLKNEIAAADSLAKLATNSGLAQVALGKLAGVTTIGNYGSSGFPGSDADLAAKAKAAADAAAAAAGGKTPVIPGATPVIPGATPVIPGGTTASTAIDAIIAAADAAAAFIESDSIAAIATIPDFIDAIGSTAADFADATAATQAAADAIDAQATSVAAIIDALAASIPGETYAAIVDSINSIDIADALGAYIGSDKASKDSGVTITINDNTSGLIQVVADAVLTNNRYGNSLVPTGTIAG